MYCLRIIINLLGNTYGFPVLSAFSNCTAAAYMTKKKGLLWLHYVTVSKIVNTLMHNPCNLADLIYTRVNFVRPEKCLNE